MTSVSNPCSGTVPSAECNEHWVARGGIRFRYLRGGSGPALVLVHGLLGYAFSFRYTVPALAEQADVYAVDLPGSGFSDRPPGLDYSLRSGAERLLSFLDAVGVEDCDVLGSSYGGALVMMAASLAPHRFRRLILAAPVHPWCVQGRFLSGFLSDRRIAPLFLRVAPRLGFMHPFLLGRLFGNEQRVPRDAQAGYSKPLAQPGAFEPPLRILGSWNRDLKELESMLPRIASLPALLLWGSLDTAVSVLSADRLQQQFERCRLQVFEGVGHLPYEEVPNAFNRAVAEFLSEARS